MTLDPLFDNQLLRDVLALVVLEWRKVIMYDGFELAITQWTRKAADYQLAEQWKSGHCLQSAHARYERQYSHKQIAGCPSPESRDSEVSKRLIRWMALRHGFAAASKTA